MAGQILSRARLKWSEWSPWIAAVLAALTVNWTADSVKDLFDAWIDGKSLDANGLKTALGCLVLLGAMVSWLYQVRNRLVFAPRTRFVKGKSPEKREHLVVYLSNLREPVIQGVPEGITLTGDLSVDLERLVKHKEQTRQFWPWEMPLRGIRHHLGRLRTLTIICSPESVREVHWFGRILRTYDSLRGISVRLFAQQDEGPSLVECPTGPLTQGGWEFEQFDDLSRALSHLLREFRREGVPENQIMIDFTGGQKVTSVVAASVTFNRRIEAQYVQTNRPYEVISYDIVVASSETGGLGF